MRKFTLALLAAALAAAASAADQPTKVVGPFVTLQWDQYAPYDAFVPTAPSGNIYPCGCVATAVAQMLAHNRWPHRLGQTVTGATWYKENEVRYDFPIRFNGNVPFAWDACRDHYPLAGLDVIDPGWTEYHPVNPKTPAATPEGYAVARAVLFSDIVSDMMFANWNGNTAFDGVPGKLSAWYEVGENTPTSDPAFCAKVEADLDRGCPVQLTFMGHQTVLIGYKIVGDDHYYYVNRGYTGKDDGWCKLSGNFIGGDEVNYAWTGLIPRRMVQVDPLPRTVSSPVALSWVLPDCHTNAVTGFRVKASTASAKTDDWSDKNVYAPVDDRDSFQYLGGIFRLSADSAVSYRVVSKCVAAVGLRLELRLDGGDWFVLDEPQLAGVNDIEPGGKDKKGGGDYLVRDEYRTVQLGMYAGRTAEFRFAVRRNGGMPNFNHSLEMSEVEIGSVYATALVAQQEVAASARGYAFGDLEEGKDYAFTVTPLFGDGDGYESEPVSVRINSAAARPLPVLAARSHAQLTNGYHRVLSTDSRSAVLLSASEGVTNVTAQVGHTVRLPDDRITVRHVKDGTALGAWAVIISPDVYRADPVRNRDTMILSLTATDVNGSVGYLDVVLQFDSAALDDEITIQSFEDFEPNDPPPVPPEPKAKPLRLLVR